MWCAEVSGWIKFFVLFRALILPFFDSLRAFYLEEMANPRPYDSMRSLNYTSTAKTKRVRFRQKATCTYIWRGMNYWPHSIWPRIISDRLHWISVTSESSRTKPPLEAYMCAWKPWTKKGRAVQIGHKIRHSDLSEVCATYKIWVDLVTQSRQDRPHVIVACFVN